MWIKDNKTYSTHSEVRQACPNTSFPASLTDEMVSEAGFEFVTESPQPIYDQAIQRIEKAVPTQVDGLWVQGWTVIDLTPDEISATQAAEVLRLEAVEASRVASLWQAAHDYEYAQVSGSAIGLLAIGVLQSLPKCLAVQGWIKSIWTEYYTRKAGTSTDTDFSVAGVCPHSVPELMLELGL